jgi:WD40 repeat protein
MTGNDRKPIAVANTPFAERVGEFSPDGRWVAYETDESGRFEIVVQPFPNPTGKSQVSSGGVKPRWRADGRELYYLAPDGRLMAVAITTQDSAFRAGTPLALFPTRVATTGASAVKAQYAVSRDGRFLINQTTGQAAVAPITLVLNQQPETKK